MTIDKARAFSGVKKKWVAVLKHRHPKSKP